MNPMRELADKFHREQNQKLVRDIMRDLPKRTEEAAKYGCYEFKVMELKYDRDYSTGFWDILLGRYRLKGPAKEVFDRLEAEGYNVKVFKPYQGPPWIEVSW